MNLQAHRITLPQTDLCALVDGLRLVELAFVPPEGPAAFLARHEARGDRITWTQTPAHRSLEDQLRRYFAGDLRAFDLPLAPRGTPFQRQVWDALLAIPYGTTTTYAALAAQLNRPAAQRAIGRANATNPIPILIPCHRLVGTDGTLTGYGGGLPLKRALLLLEGALSADLHKG